MPLIVTGSIGIDTIHTPDAKAEGILGGSCAYFAAAASFHAPVRVVAAVGGDWPDEHRRLLEKFDNICLDGLEVRPNSTTFAWGGRYFSNMNERETLFTELGVLGEDLPPVPEKYRDALESAFSRVLDATAYLVREAEQDPNHAGAVSTDYLDLLGYTIYAWFWATMAGLVADDEFGKAKRHCANFYFDRLLPKTLGLADSVKTQSASVMAMPDVSF